MCPLDGRASHRSPTRTAVVVRKARIAAVVLPSCTFVGPVRPLRRPILNMSKTRVLHRIILMSKFSPVIHVVLAKAIQVVPSHPSSTPKITASFKSRRELIFRRGEEEDSRYGNRKRDDQRWNNESQSSIRCRDQVVRLADPSPEGPFESHLLAVSSRRADLEHDKEHCYNTQVDGQGQRIRKNHRHVPYNAGCLGDRRMKTSPGWVLCRLRVALV